MESLYLVFCLVVCMPVVSGFGSGAPSGACETLKPGHKSNGQDLSPQTGTSPYTIEIVGTTTNIPEGTPVKVKITGTQYAGFLLQVRKDGATTALGTWDEVASIAKATTCGTAASSLTHTNTNAKTETQEYTWNLPAGAQGAYKFIGTVATDHDNYWVGLESSAFMVGTSSATTDSSSEDSGETTTKATGAAPRTGLAAISFILVALVSLMMV